MDAFTIWLAGFFDGEGTVIIEKSVSPACRAGFRTALHVSICQTIAEPLERIQEKFGGTLTHTQTVGPNSRRWATQYKLKWTGQKAAEVLKAIQPYLIVKRDQVAVALQYPLTDDSGRKYGNTHNPIPEEVQAERLRIQEELVRLKAVGKTMAVRVDNA